MREILSAGARFRGADGIFALPLPAPVPTLTDENTTSEIKGQPAFDLLHRYCLVRDLCVGKDVLDVAFGEGVGTALLAGVARRVVGVETDDNVVARARALYINPNLEFLQGDVTALPSVDATFDVAVSFETLEHLPDRAAFLTQIRRVLRPGGVLVIGMRSHDVRSAPRQPVSRLHALLNDFFVHHQILTQRPLLGSVMAPIDVPTDGWRSYERHASEIEAMHGLSPPFYLVAVASDLAIRELGSSIYGDNATIDDTINASADLR